MIFSISLLVESKNTLTCGVQLLDRVGEGTVEDKIIGLIYMHVHLSNMTSCI